MKSDKIESEVNEILDRGFFNIKNTVRTDSSVAKFMLKNNTTKIIGGKVCGFDISHIGLGVYEIKLNTESNSTKLI